MPAAPFRAARQALVFAVLACIVMAFSAGSAGAFGQPMLSGGDDFSCALNDSGVERCWGSSYADVMGLVPAGANPAPVEIAGGAGAVAIANTNSTNCALLGDATIRCWGESYGGELGRGVFTSADPQALPVVGISTATQIGAAGGGTFCAGLSNGTANCWGGGTHRELGNGGNTDQSTPVMVIGLTTIKKIVSGSGTSCALLTAGTISCWGENADGEMGNNTAGADVAIPSLVPGITDAIDVGVGSQSVCALRATGDVLCWGDNFYGELGDGDITGASKHIPTAVSSVAGAKQISIGGTTGCALLGDGTVRCWGYADQGETGTGTNAGKVYSPTAVPGVANVEQLPQTIGTTVCVMQHGGAVICWGSDTYGATGLAPVQPISGPHTVSGLNLISARSATASSVAVTGKPKLDKKHKYFTLLGQVNATPAAVVLQSTACSGPVKIAGSYVTTTYKVTRKHGKKVRKKVKKTHKFSAGATLVPAQTACAGAFKVKLKAKTLARKKLKLSATFDGNGAMLAFATPNLNYTMPKLPKVKKK